GEGSASSPGFPEMPISFQHNRDFDNIASGLLNTGLNAAEVDGIMGNNWLRFFENSFGSLRPRLGKAAE
ncbi:MAG: membrane dipeptidase, partial [Hyphomicrobiales bacterium]|nr:membrane dipeptidase [Hyphomicrobiales bacterium]